MISQYNHTMTKLQLSLTDQEESILSLKAARLGYSVTRYVKFLISQEAAKTINPDDNLPTFPMSPELEEIGLQALKDHRAGKTTVLENIEDIGKL